MSEAAAQCFEIFSKGSVESICGEVVTVKYLTDLRKTYAIIAKKPVFLHIELSFLGKKTKTKYVPLNQNKSFLFHKFFVFV